MTAANRPRGATAIRADQRQLNLPRLPRFKVPQAYRWAGAAILVCFAIAVALSPSEEHYKHLYEAVVSLYDVWQSQVQANRKQSMGLQ